jgi:hypothetical protein
MMIELMGHGFCAGCYGFVIVARNWGTGHMLAGPTASQSAAATTLPNRESVLALQLVHFQFMRPLLPPPGDLLGFGKRHCGLT